MIAVDFLLSSSSVKAGLVVVRVWRGGDGAAVSRLTVQTKHILFYFNLC